MLSKKCDECTVADKLQLFRHIAYCNLSKPEDILTAEAVDLLATKLRTPLQSPVAPASGDGGRIPEG